MKRGDVVVAATPGDCGKPRPAVVVQSDVFNPTHASIVVCPLTSYLVDAPLFRLTVQPNAENGLQVESQVMVDNLAPIRRDRLGTVIGHLDVDQLASLDSALGLWLDLVR